MDLQNNTVMEFQSYLSQKYQGHESFIENIIIPIFGEDNYDTKYDVEMLDSEELQNQAARTGIRSILRCGTINLDLAPIEVFDITVSNRLMMDKNRVGVQAVIRRVMDTYSGAFMLIHYDNDVKWDWRFTFCQLKDKKEYSDSKRYTFLLGPNQSCRTAAQNFQKLADLHEDITIKDIVSAFDVEALSEAFFDEYKKHYERFVEHITGKRFVKEGGRFVETVSHAPHKEYYHAFGNDDKAVRDYTKLLLARIVFLHFLQKKGWLGVPKDGKWGEGDEQFMSHLYQRASEAQKNDFLESILEPLFFDALNGNRSNDNDLFDTKVLGTVRIPYLNGGLFSRDILDDIVIRYPKEFFGDFLDFLYQYNFTIDENDPNEAQVGIDPEMLGKIFENLLEDNKDKGAFYTPKEVVLFMCQESLIAYLGNKTGLDEKRLRLFVTNPDVYVQNFNNNEKYDILDAILSVKICDPAIGSGAFPIGLLNELVRCKEAIYGDEKGRAEIKKEIIRDNIYGIDIEKGAVDIARLRFWLSLIVDEDEPLPLPNLDYKIMQGNSLLEWFNGSDLSRLSDMAAYDDMFGGGRAEDLKNELSRLLKEYYGESSQDRKIALKVDIKQTITEILDIAGVEIPESLDISENNQFFLWHTWFSDVFAKGGFDICIGNPPYIRQEKLDHSYKQLLCSIYPEVGFGTADILVYFFGLGLNILSENGVLIFITSNKFLKTQYGLNIRKHFAEKVDVDFIIDFFELPVFNASTDAAITKLFKKAPISDTHYFPMLTLENLNLMKRVNEDFLLTLKNDGEWQFVKPESISILNKIYDGTIPLGEFVGGKVFRGITTGLNQAFVLKDADVIQSLIHSESAPLVKRYAQSTSIKKWNLTKDSTYFLATGFDLDIENSYPTAYKHLESFQPDLGERCDQGQTCYNLRACAYYDEFEKHKLIYIHTAKDHQFYLDLDGRYINNSCYMIGSESRYLFAFLNSKLFKFFKRIKFVAYGNGDEGGRCKLDYNKMITVPIKNNIDETPFKQVVDEAINIKRSNPNADVSDYDRQLDSMIYRLYGLSDSEVLLVEGTCDITD